MKRPSEGGGIERGGGVVVVGCGVGSDGDEVKEDESRNQESADQLLKHAARCSQNAYTNSISCFKIEI